MKIQWRIFLGFAVLLATGFFFLVRFVADDVRYQLAKATEVSLVDMANILADFIETDMATPLPETDRMAAVFHNNQNRRFSAHIYELTKSRVEIRVYVADHRGVVIYDSDEGRATGADFSEKNDVYLTLKGEYGARTTRRDLKDPLTSIYYVAAPIYFEKNIVGAVTVASPVANLNLFIQNSRKKIFVFAAAAFFMVLLLSYLISLWITGPIKRLTEYARSVGKEPRKPLPELGSGETKVLGKALADMQVELEGKRYVEETVQALTHQLKGPLSAIHGAAELLSEDMDTDDRRKFLNNISRESRRIQEIVDRMLKLAVVEKQKQLENVMPVNLVDLVNETEDSLSAFILERAVICRIESDDSPVVSGDRFLLRQAVENLIRNAIEFSPKGSTVTVKVSREELIGVIRVLDEGTGIPDYARERIFDRFYSLPRPDTGQKSSGLGLALVREVALLHQGTVALDNRPGAGVIATLRLPLQV
ncbi:MAG: two-component system sensor histidine kinase CreC, partial [Holophagae bacterium]|nr:two-component system sensor histidine kinase CreC [Holophagae bacterium]